MSESSHAIPPGAGPALGAPQVPDPAPEWAQLLANLIARDGIKTREAVRREVASEASHAYYLLLLVACFVGGYCWTSMRQTDKRARGL